MGVCGDSIGLIQSKLENPRVCIAGDKLFKDQ